MTEFLRLAAKLGCSSMMRWFVAAVVAGAAVVNAACLVEDKQLARWTTPPLIPLREDAGTTDLFPMTECFGFELEEASIDEIQRAMESGQLTSVQLVMCYMLRAHQTEQYIK